jgi:hypothetical protein
MKKSNDAWPVAPEASAYKPESSEGTSAITMLKSLAVVPIVGVAVIIFGAIAQPHLHRATTGQPDTSVVTAAATPLPGNAPAPAGANGTPPAVQDITPSVKPGVEASPVLPVIQVASPAPSSQSPTVPATAPAPAQHEIAQFQPAVAGAGAVAPVAQTLSPSIAVTGEPGIRSTNVVIEGHIYECYGQQAHLACDLKQ